MTALGDFTRGLRAGWAGHCHRRAESERNYARIVHETWIPLLMPSCDHYLLTYSPYDDEPQSRLNPDGTVRSDRVYCWRCAGVDKVPGTPGLSIRLALNMAELYDWLAGDRRPK